MRWDAASLALLLALLAAPASWAAETEAQSGPVRVVLRLTPDAPVVGDRLTLEIEVTAEEGIEVLMPEFGEALDRFTILDFVPREGLDDQGNTLLSQRYTLQAPMSGAHTLPSLLVEFVDHRPGRDPAPEGQAAYELLTEPIALQVESVLPDAAQAELSPPAARLDPRREAGSFPWLWGLIPLALSLGAAPFLWRAFVAARARARRRSAYDIAQAELAELASVPRSSDAEIDAFFVRLSGVVRRYLEDRFGLRSPEYTTEEFLDRMSASPELRRGHQGLLRDFLELADLVKFARQMPPSEKIEDSLRSARQFVEETGEATELGTQQGSTPRVAAGGGAR